GRRKVRRGLGQGSGHRGGGGRGHLLPHCTTFVTAPAVRYYRGGGGDGDLRVQPSGFGDQWGGAAGRRRRRAIHRVSMTDGIEYFLNSFVRGYRSSSRWNTSLTVVVSR